LLGLRRLILSLPLSDEADDTAGNGRFAYNLAGKK
jgi:hypothetical protein